MKKLSYLLPLFLITNCSYADYLHGNADQFYDDNISITFPCTVGGTPLVIYSTPINNNAPISSTVPLYPIYVENGYTAEPLTIDHISQNNQVSTSDLIVQNYNPATGAGHFGLSRSDQQKFYVNSVNFASIDGTQNSRYVSSFNVSANGSTYSETIVPIPMYPEDQDVGILVGASIKKIEGTQYAWNQKGKWRSYNNTALYPINYHFSPEPIGNSQQHYNGFGFWVCGSDTPPAEKALATEPIYHDTTTAAKPATL